MGVLLSRYFFQTDTPTVATPVTADTSVKSTSSTPIPADPAVQISPQSPQINGNPKSPEDNNNLHANMNLNAAMLSVNNFLRDDLKSPYRTFDEHRSPFRFADELIPGAIGRLGESLIPKGDPMEARLQEMLRYFEEIIHTWLRSLIHLLIFSLGLLKKVLNFIL